MCKNTKGDDGELYHQQKEFDMFYDIILNPTYSGYKFSFCLSLLKWYFAFFFVYGGIFAKIRRKQNLPLYTHSTGALVGGPRRVQQFNMAARICN